MFGPTSSRLASSGEKIRELITFKFNAPLTADGRTTDCGKPPAQQTNTCPVLGL